MLTQHEILSYLTEHKEEFSKRFGIVKLGLFGSFSRGTPKEESDIDILIELDNIEDIHRKKVLFRQQLENKFHRKIDIAREKYLSPLAKQTIMDDVIYVK